MNASSPLLPAALAFDCLAAQYDEVFTDSLIGRAQRNVVWNAIDRTFRPGQKILELNCGTGEDAMHLAQLGVSVVACDASARMIEVASRKAGQMPGAAATFHQLPSERVSELAFRAPFDGLLSNFAGLNCVTDLADMADQLASLLRPGAWMLLCVCSRYCLWEVLAYGLQGKFKKAFRRFTGHTRAQVCGIEVPVQYPTVSELQSIFSPWFALRSSTAVGLAIPPSYMEAWCRRHPRLFEVLVQMDEAGRSLPVVRGLGDHVLLAFQRCEL
jgi:2-polyprenyl-3-methyl-5-hydroxy-6-metoxy-1,4-benzoquinol methylase